ncbi:MAG: hypothetical protein ACXW2T_07205, partial [Allosphingosinicella sp.]
MASERVEPAEAAAKAWRRDGQRLRRTGSPAMIPPRRGKLFPLAENHHENGVLRRTSAPAPAGSVTLEQA